MAYTSFSTSNEGEGDEQPDLGQMFGPGHVDQSIRQAVQACWMALPKSRRNVNEVEQQIRRLMERALNDLREDSAAFGHEEDA